MKAPVPFRVSLATVVTLAGVLPLLLGGGGCAAKVHVPTVGNPAAGPAVKISRVTDRRVFGFNTRDARSPSVVGSVAPNKATTSRAIAVSFDPRTKAWENVLLPADQSVETLIEEVLTRAFRDAGYRVIREGAAEYNTALPVETDIRQYWMRFTQNEWGVTTLEFETRLLITAHLAPFENGEEVHRKFQLRSVDDISFAWPKVMNRGLQDLARSVRERLDAGKAGGGRRSHVPHHDLTNIGTGYRFEEHVAGV